MSSKVTFKGIVDIDKQPINQVLLIRITYAPSTNLKTLNVIAYDFEEP